jgi:methylamine dehydrogenase accessory protein MauD
VNPVAVSEIMLWILQIATILVVVGLVRQIGLLHIRLPARGAGAVSEAPPIGTTVTLSEIISFGSRSVNVLTPGRVTLIVFANPGCSLCAPILEAAHRLMRVDRTLNVVVAADGESSVGLEYVRSHGFSDAVPAEPLNQLDGAHRPFAVALSAGGTVLASGVPNTLEQLEELRLLAESCG